MEKTNHISAVSPVYVSCEEHGPGLRPDPAHGALDPAPGQPHPVRARPADADVAAGLHHDLTGPLHTHDALDTLRYHQRLIIIILVITTIIIIILNVVMIKEIPVHFPNVKPGPESEHTTKDDKSFAVHVHPQFLYQ